MNETFKRKLTRGDLLIGTILSLPSPEIAEILCGAGFDWLFVDLEHSAMSFSDAQAILQAASPNTPCVIRVPSLDEVWIKKALDLGPAGIILPQLQTAEQAKLAVQLCKYPPDGSRSVGIARAHGYGPKFQEYVRSANDVTAVIIQIEHINAVNNINEIIRVPGIDCLYVGPYDLSTSMGKPGQTTDPVVQNAIKEVEKSTTEAKIPLGIFGADAAAVKPYIQRGYRLITVGTDTMMIAETARSFTELLK